jgi:NAD(P)-dependent dehydrogenase (short-subunit alcohol dehydrogenase family)
MQRFENQVAIVTGGGRGIGRASALRLAGEGAAVAVTDIDREPADEVVKAIRAAGGEALALQLDVTSRSQVEQMLTTVLAEYNQVDVLANIAGIGFGEPFLVARHMVVDQVEGRIVNMASTNGLVGEADFAHYNAAKFGVVGLTMTMAIELAPYNIRVNSVCPGLIKTRLSQGLQNNPAQAADYLTKIPLDRFGEPEEVAAAVAYLASADSGFVTGHQLVIDGGQLTF